MSNTNRIEKIEDETEEEMIDKFLQYFNDKYGIPKEVLMESLDKSSIKYTLNKYKFNIEDINYEIESKTINRKDGGDSDKNDVIDGIKSFFARLEKSQEENINNNDINLSSNNKQKNVDNRKMLKKKPEPKNAPAKNKEMKIQINSNINIKYNSSIVYNLGENQMEKQFNPVNIITDINGLKIIDSYQLLPKDSTVERIGYENYFKNFKNNLLRELKIPEDDPLLGETKFVLFVAFDVIDQKPNFDDLVGIDPLNDYKKYVLKIDINDPNLFLASGQIIFLEGDLIVTVHIKKNKQFRREGDHLYIEQQISFPQAALGDLISIPTIEGKEVEFKITPGTQSGTVFKLRSQGMTSYRHQGRGNMYVTVTVVVPKKLNSKQKKLLNEFAEISGDEIKHVEKGIFDRVKDAMK